MGSREITLDLHGAHGPNAIGAAMRRRTPLSPVCPSAARENHGTNPATQSARREREFETKTEVRIVLVAPFQKLGSLVAFVSGP